ncbi:MAG: MBL fold metallo-hydrolase [Neobacillus sp.]
MSNFLVHKIDEHTWRIEDPIKVYMYLVEGETSALLIDSGMGFEGLDDIVRSLTDKPVQVVNTHGHVDHIGSNYLFDTVYLSEMDKSAIQEHLDLEYRKVLIPGLLESIDSEEIRAEIQKLIHVPEKENLQYINEGHIFDLGGRQLEVIWTPGHSPGSICLLDSQNRQLFCADTVTSLGVLLHISHSTSVETFRDSLIKLYNRRDEFDFLYPGHHEVPIKEEHIKEHIECAEMIINGEAAAVPLPDSVIGSGFVAMHKGISITFKQEYSKEKEK